GAGIVVARPGRGLAAILQSSGAGGVVARRLLLAPVLIPLITGWLRIAAVKAGIDNPELSGWLFAIANITVFTLIIWWCAGALHRADSERAASDQRFRAVAETANQAIVTADSGSHIIYLNGAAE